jgi:DNA (cytosine-5)-methyltransferase 1
MKRDNFTIPLDLGHELIIDNFAGGGGASTALRMALGREPDIAINHDGEALCMHEANHPTTNHYQEDVYLIHPGFVTKQQPIGVAWFSPTCTHFSKAKGGNLLNQKVRGLAWVTFKWAVLQMPRTMYLENVEEFLGWGPLDAEGRPIKEHKGRTFEAFVMALTTGIPKGHPDLPEIRDALGADFPIERLYAGLGYQVEWRVLRACDYGAPTIRRRLFMVMRRDARPIVWPKPTHGPRDSEQVRAGKQLPYLTAADCIDFSIPCPSIFERKKPLKPATLRRVGKGFERYVKDCPTPYIVGQGGPAYSGKPVPADRPIGTLTTENHRAVVVPSLVQYYSGGGQNAAVDAGMPTIVTKDRIGVTCAYLAKHYQGVVGAPVNMPAPTVTTVDHTSLITAHMVGIDNRRAGDSATWAATAPITTIVTENKHALVTSNMVKLRGTSNAAATDTPLGTISAGGEHHAEVRTTFASTSMSAERRAAVRAFLWEYCPSLRGVEQPELVKIHGELMEVVDIGLRMLQPRELANAQGFPPDYVLDPFYTKTDKKGKQITRRLSNSAQVRMIGNSVSPPPAIALLRANSTHEFEMTRAA